jgi:hypothetical protein
MKSPVEVQPAPGFPKLFCVVAVHAGVTLRSEAISTRAKADDFAWVAQRELGRPETKFFRKWAPVETAAAAAP